MNRIHLYGDGIFETMFVSNGRIRIRELHEQRLSTALQTFANSEVQGALDYLDQHIKQHYSSDTWRIRLTISRNTSGLYTPKSDKLNFSIQAVPINTQSLRRERLVSCLDYLLVYDHMSHLKSCSALSYVLAARYAQSKDATAAILFNHEGQVAETSGSNIFFLINNQLVTPPLTSGCLPGVTRGFALDTARKHGIRIIIREINRFEFRHIQAACTTNAIHGAKLVQSIDQQTLADHDQMLHFARLIHTELKNTMGDPAA